MKRIEVKLSLPVVAPLLDVIRELVAGLRQSLAINPPLDDLDPDLRETWSGDLIGSQQEDLDTLLALFNQEFFFEGVVAFDPTNAEAILRACAAVRLRLRQRRLKGMADEALETGEIDLDALDESVRKAFLCYLFLATIQELILQHLDDQLSE